MQSGYRPCTMHSFECISRGLGTLLLKRIVFAWRLRIGPSPRCEPQLRVGVEVDERRHISMVPHERLHLRDLCIRADRVSVCMSQISNRVDPQPNREHVQQSTKCGGCKSPEKGRGQGTD
jgi:hypothetical protein